MSDLQKLEILLSKVTKISQTFNEKKKQDELRIIIQRYNYYKKHIDQPIRNQHYINCVWSNDQQCNQLTSIDLCSCYYIERFPRQLCLNIVDKFGLEYMLYF